MSEWLVITATPKMTTEHNIESWEEVVGLSDWTPNGIMHRQTLEYILRFHPKVGAGKGFVNYCIKNNWLMEWIL